MDIEYLLILQKFRGVTESYLAPLMNWVTKFAISFWPLAFIFMVYWSIDRKIGRRMICGCALGSFMNGFLKLTFCVYRPWIRDARIIPYGDSMVAATGYSFPSGHSTAATCYYGSMAIWLRKKYKALTGFLIFMILLTMFSRNYLGVHTPQDVLVGCLATFVMLYCGYAIENWSDKNPAKRDYTVLIAGIVLCVAALIYYLTKNYPHDYKPDGSLIVDPKKMLPDSFEGLGWVVSFCICRLIERRGYDFESELDWKVRFIIGFFALMPLMWWNNHIISIFYGWNLRCLGKFVWTSVMPLYAMVFVPFVMKKVAKTGLVDKIHDKLLAK